MSWLTHGEQEGLLKGSGARNFHLLREQRCWWELQPFSCTSRGWHPTATAHSRDSVPHSQPLLSSKPTAPSAITKWKKTHEVLTKSRPTSHLSRPCCCNQPVSSSWLRSQAASPLLRRPVPCQAGALWRWCRRAEVPGLHQSGWWQALPGSVWHTHRGQISFTSSPALVCFEPKPAAGSAPGPAPRKHTRSWLFAIAGLKW